jgi:hypothetical protein
LSGIQTAQADIEEVAGHCSVVPRRFRAYSSCYGDNSVFIGLGAESFRAPAEFSERNGGTRGGHAAGMTARERR